MVDALATSAQGPNSPAWRVRVSLLAGPLGDHGVRLRLAPLFVGSEGERFGSGAAAARARVLVRARRRLAAQLRAADSPEVAVVQRQVDLLPSLRLERMATSRRRVVLDIDDAVWIEGPASGGHPLARLKRSERKLAWLAERAGAVLAGNQMLADHLARYADRVTVVPSLVDVERYPQRSHRQAESIVLGWIGSPTTLPYLEAVLPRLERLKTAIRRRRVELLVVGGHLKHAPDGVVVTHLPWSEATEREALQQIDIGLMPLPDTPWTRGKCAYKALQYMAAGIPVVADPVGVSAEVIGDWQAGLIADGREWPEALATLAADEALRARMGAEGRRRVAADFSYERWLPVIAAAIRGD